MAFFQSVLDFFSTIGHLISNFYSDLVNIVTMLYKVLFALPGYLAWIPGEFLIPITYLIVLVIALRVLQYI